MKQDKKLAVGIIGAVVVVVLAAAGGWFYLRSRGSEVVPTQAEQPIPAPVVVPPEQTGPAPIPVLDPITQPQAKPPASTPAPKPAPSAATQGTPPPAPAPKPSSPKPAPPNPAEVIQSGITALNSKDYATAVTLFRKARQLQPNNPDLGYLLGMSLESAGELEPAREAFETCTSGPYAQIAKGHIKTITQKLKKRR